MEDHYDKLVSNQLLDTINQEIQGFVKVLDRPSEDCWFVEFPGIKLVGFFSCEDNESDIQTPTISMAIFLYDITDATKSQLLNLFAVNGDMHGCWFLAECIDDRWRLVLNRRIMVESYQPGELRDNIMLMLGRFSIFQDRIEQTLSAI
ncbi:MAG: hypothetical protein GXZ09_08595 [Syntrophomonadaceae bacterium]|nr:hypothetical protein [Syntrophomonadaceae bacterium]